MRVRSFAQGEILKVNASSSVLTTHLPVFCVDDHEMMDRWSWEKLARPTEFVAFSTELDVTALTVWVEGLADHYHASDVIYRIEPTERDYFHPMLKSGRWGVPAAAGVACVFIIIDDPESKRRQERQSQPTQYHPRQYAMIAFRKDQGYGMVMHTHGDCISIQAQQLGSAAILQTFEPPPGDGIWVWEGEPFGRPGMIANYSNGEWRRPSTWEWQQLQLGQDPFNLGRLWLPLQPEIDIGNTLTDIRNHLLNQGVRWFRAKTRRE